MVSQLMNNISRSILFCVVVALVFVTATWHFNASESHSSLTRIVKQWQPMENHPAIITFSRDGGLLAVSNVLSKDIRIFSVPGYQLIRTLGKSGEARSIAFSPDNKTLAVGSQFSRTVEQRNSIRLWNIQSAEVIWEPPGFIEGSKDENDVRALVFDPTGKYLLASLTSSFSKNSFHLFLIDLEKKTTKSFCTSTANSIDFSPNGDRIVSGGYDGMKMWSASGDKLVWKQPINHGNKSKNSSPANMVVFSPDGSRLLVSAEGTVKIYNSVDGRLQTTLPITLNYPKVIAAYSPNGKYVVVASDHLWILDASTLSVLEESELPNMAFSLSFNPNGKLFSVGTDSGFVVVREFVTH